MVESRTPHTLKACALACALIAALACALAAPPCAHAAATLHKNQNDPYASCPKGTIHIVSLASYTVEELPAEDGLKADHTVNKAGKNSAGEARAYRCIKKGYKKAKLRVTYNNAAVDEAGRMIQVVCTFKWVLSKEADQVRPIYAPESAYVLFGGSGLDRSKNSGNRAQGAYVRTQVNLYYQGTSTPAAGAFKAHFTDIDQPGLDKDKDGNRLYSGDYVEGITLRGGYDGNLYMGSRLVYEKFNNDGDSLYRVRGTKSTRQGNNAATLCFLAYNGLDITIRGCGGAGIGTGLIVETIPYTVVYDGNGATGGSTAPTAHKWGVKRNLAANGFVKTGYTFSCWSVTTYNRLVDYGGGAPAINLCSTPNYPVPAKAKWNPNAYTVAYNLDGGSWPAGVTPTTSTRYDAGAFAVRAPTRLGYTFQGWTVTGMDGCTHYFDGSTNKATFFPLTKATSFKNLRSTPDTVTFTAKWAPNVYSLSYDLQGGDWPEGASHPDTAAYDQAFEASNPVWDNHRFEGWSIAGMDGCTHWIGGEATTDAAREGVFATSYKNLRCTAGTVTYTASWTPLATLVLHVDDTEAVWRTVVLDNLGQNIDVPASDTEDARRPDCHRLDGSQGLDAWYWDGGYSEKFEAQPLEPGVYHLYARNWATVGFANGPASDAAVEYTSGDQAGGIAAASGTPAAFEKPYGGQALLAEPARGRVRFDAGGTFPATLVAERGWHLEEDCSDAAFTSMTVTRDATVWKKWQDAVTDGIAANGGERM